jgi:ribosomal protein S9
MVEKEIHHIGKRKTAIARVYLRPRKGEVGNFNVNGRTLTVHAQHFKRLLCSLWI